MQNQPITRQEILSQPEAWAAALQVFTAAQKDIVKFASGANFEQIIFTGCGSTYYLALAAAALTQQLTGRPARGLPASELWLYQDSSYTAGRTLLVAVSRSGETTETLRACQAFLEANRGELVTLSCYGDMPLAKMGTLNLVFPSGQEQSVAQTRAFSTLYLGTVALAALWAGQPHLVDSLARLPQAGQRLIEQAAPLAAEFGPDLTLERFYWLGSGPRYGLAAELSLKMKEMSLSHSEPFHFLEFRHGPQSMVTNASLVIGLQSSTNSAYENAVLEDVSALGGRSLSIGETGTTVRFEAGLDEVLRNVLYLPAGQLIALERSLSKGLNPDQPHNLDTVVRL
ncbi:MAG: SIS domain-containing protein [Anaerolineales bacterium]|nr:SIS domain-containing protein [Anaerolineales bacterium]